MHVNYNTDAYIKFRKVPLTTKSQISISYFVFGSQMLNQIQTKQEG